MTLVAAMALVGVAGGVITRAVGLSVSDPRTQGATLAVLAAIAGAFALGVVVGWSP